MPVSTGIGRVLDYQLKSEKDVASGYPSLDAGGKIPVAEIPDLSATYLPLIGGTMIGNLDFTGAQLHMNDNYISLGYQTGIQAIGGGVPRDLTFYDSATPGGVTLSTLKAGSGADHGSLLGLGDDDHTQYLLVNGSRQMTGNLEINKIIPGISFYHSGTERGRIFVAAGVTFAVHPIVGSLSLGEGSQITNIGGSVVNLTTFIYMGTNKITGLAAATANGDALRYEQLVGAYLPLAAGSGSKLIGDLWINKTDPSLVFQDAVNTIGYLNCFSAGGIALQSNIGNINLTSVDTTKSISCVIGAVNKFKVENALITAAVALAMGTNNITDTGDVLPHDSGNHYCGDSSHHFLSLYSRTINIPYSPTVNAYIVTNGAGSLLFATPAGTRLAIADAAIGAAVPLAMGANKITGLAAATAAGDAVRFEQNVTYSMEVADNNVGINPADASTYYFGHIGIAASTTANAQSHLRKIPRTGFISAAMIIMYATTAGTAENISVYIRLNNTTDTLVATVGAAALVRSFSNVALNIAVTVGDNIEIKIVNPTWATNPLVVTWDGTLIITS